MHIYILRLIEKVLLWNDNADYLKESEITCLESVLLKTLNLCQPIFKQTAAYGHFWQR